MSEPDYRDYVIRDGRLIGRFEEMYRDVSDPWHCNEAAGELKGKLLCCLASTFPSARRGLDLGCGLGALTARLRDTLPETRWQACDVSATAVAKAGAAHAGIDFLVHDLGTGTVPAADSSLDLITMSEVMWYVLEPLDALLADVTRALAPGGRLLVQQYFLDPAEQSYGRELVSSPQDLLTRIERAGLTLEHEIYWGRRPPNVLVASAQKRGGLDAGI